MGALTVALARKNVISGPGRLKFEGCQSVEKLGLDNEICGMAFLMVSGINAPPGRWTIGEPSPKNYTHQITIKPERISCVLRDVSSQAPSGESRMKDARFTSPVVSAARLIHSERAGDTPGCVDCDRPMGFLSSALFFLIRIGAIYGF
jgi:hypothetical protein